LLLDEPVAGVPAGEREELLQTVAALPADVSVLKPLYNIFAMV
jgi:branched-chain amino acid transport system ATP-binding protein